MSEWWTYRLSDFLLFSPRIYYRLIEQYNADVWPGHLLALAAAVAIVLRPRWARPLLAAAWAWVAWGFLYTRYATINWAAVHVAAAFGLQAVLLSISWERGRLARIGDGAGGASTLWAGGAPALPGVLYLLVAPLFGRPWAQAEVFGVMPDPTALVTIGLAAASRRWWLLPIPLLWCVVSGLTLWAMRSPDAWVPPTLALLVVIAAWRRRR